MFIFGQQRLRDEPTRVRVWMKSESTPVVWSITPDFGVIINPGSDAAAVRVFSGPNTPMERTMLRVLHLIPWENIAGIQLEYDTEAPPAPSEEDKAAEQAIIRAAMQEQTARLKDDGEEGESSEER